MNKDQPLRLRGYAEYIALTKDDVKAKERQIAARFQARWLLAMNFDGINLKGSHDSRTVRGYSALLKVTLAYSTFDQLARLLETKPNWPIPDTSLADNLRQRLDLNSIKSDENTSKTSFTDIETTDDVTRFAAAIRHMFAHGSGTPWGSTKDLTSQTIVHLEELATALLTETENRFDFWVKDKIASAALKESATP